MIHIVNRSMSKMTNIMVAFDAGARVEEDFNYSPGIAHMLEHCIFKGTVKRNWQDISRDIGFLGGDVNAFTSHDIVAYYITVPKENTESAVDILSDIVLNSQVPDEEFQKEREVVKEEEISGLDDVDSYMWKNFSENFFDNYISRPVIGTQDTISEFTGKEVLSFYKKYCNISRGIVAISGCDTKSSMKKLLVRYFGKSSKKSVRDYSGVVSSYSKSRVLEIIKPGIEHTYLWLGYPGPTSRDINLPALKLLSVILGSGMDSRLFSEVREKRGLAYGIGCGMSQWEYGGLSMIDGSTREDNVLEMIDVIREQISEIKNTFVTDEELQRAKNKMLAMSYRANESSYSKSYLAIKNAMFGDLLLDEFIEKVLMVSREDVASAANQVFDTDRELLLLCRGK